MLWAIRGKFQNVTEYERNLSPIIIVSRGDHLPSMNLSNHSWNWRIIPLTFFPNLDNLGLGNYLILDNARVKLSSNFTRHHLITHATNLLWLLLKAQCNGVGLNLNDQIKCWDTLGARGYFFWRGGEKEKREKKLLFHSRRTLFSLTSRQYAHTMDF